MAEEVARLFEESKAIVLPTLLRPASVGVAHRQRLREEGNTFSGLRPQLGHLVNETKTQDESREAWKQSPEMARSVQTVVEGLTIVERAHDPLFFKAVRPFDRFLVSFILNVIDDADLAVKVQGYTMLQALVGVLEAARRRALTEEEFGALRALVQTFCQANFVTLFIEAVQPGLYTHLPLNSSLTSGTHSFNLMVDLLGRTYALLGGLYTIREGGPPRELLGEVLLVEGLFRSLPLVVNDKPRVEGETVPEFAPAKTLKVLLRVYDKVIEVLGDVNYLYLSQSVNALNAIITSPNIQFENRTLILTQALVVYQKVVAALAARIERYRYDIIGGLAMMVQMTHKVGGVLVDSKVKHSALVLMEMVGKGDALEVKTILGAVGTLEERGNAIKSDLGEILG